MSFQFALHSTTGGVCELRVAASDGGLGTPELYRVVPVPVEANTNGGSQTAVGRRPPERWLQSFIREAPFEVGEVLQRSTNVRLKPDRTASVALIVPVPQDARPGLYRGKLTAQLGAQQAEVPYEFQVYDVLLTKPSVLAVDYWLSPAPRDLTSGPPPAWWSERHWALLRSTAESLHAFGQTHVLTPVVKGEHPLTEITRCRDGSYRFAFDRFDRWVQLFLDCGYTGIQGHHVSLWGGVYGMDEATGRREKLVGVNTGAEFDRFLSAFFSALREHLAAKHWLGIYQQHLIDECDDVARYRHLQSLARQHLAGVKIVDAINRHPRELGELVDVPVLSIQYAEKLQAETRSWRKAGKQVWYYNCCSPAPPLPNRHLDEPLVCSRLYPWYAWLFGAEGYLNWGGNMYRGADPYATSVGPLPNGSQNPGHPPGDNWHFYPTPNGLVPGLRMLAFRDGLQDHALLVMLAKRNPERARGIAAQLATGLASYSRNPKDYHVARTALLKALVE